MRAVMLEVPEYLLEERRRLGHDRWDEMWDGELHMLPPPHGDHGRLNDRLGTFFLLHWEMVGLGRSYPETGVKRLSPGDESRAKLPFYLSVGVREVVLIDRRTRAVEVLRATDAGWAQVKPSEGWVRSDVLRSEWRTDGPVLHVRRWDEPARELRIEP